MKPSIGRIVHYTSGTGKIIAAIITDVNDDGTCELCIFPAMGSYPDMSGVRMTTAPAGSAEAKEHFSEPLRF